MMLPQIQELHLSQNLSITHRLTTSTTPQKIYAKAIYDNIADNTDELAFKKGDTLNVIEQDTDGLEGWWLCSLRGRQGICPGNRLRIINSYDSGCFSISPSSSPSPSISLGASTVTLNSSILSSSEIYENTHGGSGSSYHISSPTPSLSSTTSSLCTPSGQQQFLYNNYNNTASSHQQHQNYYNNINNQQGKRRSWNVTPHKVITPRKCGDVYLYIVPQIPNRISQYQNNLYQNVSTILKMSDSDSYDIPKPVTPISYDCSKHQQLWSKPLILNPKLDTITTTTTSSSSPNTSGLSTPTTPRQLEEDSSYDIPRASMNLFNQQQQNMTPSSSNSSLLTSDSMSLSFSSSNRSSLANMPDYDVPRRNPPQVIRQSPAVSTTAAATAATTAAIAAQNSNNCHQYNNQQPQQTYDFPQSQQLMAAATITKVLPLELTSALETLATLQTESTTAIARVLAYVSPNWRSAEKLEPVLMDIKLAVVRLKTALHDLAEFSEGSLGNAAKADDKNLAVKLRPLVKNLQDADKLIHKTSHIIESHGWTVNNLLRDPQKKHLISVSSDSLDQLIACAQTLTEDVRQSTSFIQGNASLLFKRQLTPVPSPSTRPTSSTPATNGNGNSSNNEWVQDYDYVLFETKDSAAMKNSDLRDAIPQNLKNKFDNVLKNAETQAMHLEKVELLDANDKLLVKYYAVQISTHMRYLTEAIDSFLETVEKNQPPKFFIAYGKFVVLSAHNLVSIGDIVHRNINKLDLKTRIEQYTDSLAEALKSCVIKSKKAAQHFPSVTAVQEMVDSVVDISHLASDLKLSMLQIVHA